MKYSVFIDTKLCESMSNSGEGSEATERMAKRRKKKKERSAEGDGVVLTLAMLVGEQVR